MVLWWSTFWSKDAALQLGALPKKDPATYFLLGIHELLWMISSYNNNNNNDDNNNNNNNMNVIYYNTILLLIIIILCPAYGARTVKKYLWWLFENFNQDQSHIFWKIRTKIFLSTFIKNPKHAEEYQNQWPSGFQLKRSNYSIEST